MYQWCICIHDCVVFHRYTIIAAMSQLLLKILANFEYDEFVRLETGVPARVKPFGVEVRNVKCVRCGNYGHQSGDRECPLKDVIMPNEESRLKRNDPLTAILAHTDPNEVSLIIFMIGFVTYLP